MYRIDLLTSARRHFLAANELHDNISAGSQPGCKAVAGYLFGLSGELAVKELMRNSGMQPLSRDSRRDDPFYAHFPELKSRLKDTVSGRQASELRKIAESPSLFQNWNTEMRYAPTVDIKVEWITAWRKSAEELIEKINLL